MAVWGNIGNALKGGVQKVGNVFQKAPKTLDNLNVVKDTITPEFDKITFDPVQNTINNMDNLTLDPNKKPPVDIDKLTFEDMLNGEESQPKKTGQDGFANALSGVGSKFQVTPSRVDYSQFMGLSPETQKYLYGGL
jgi:hypothetical protein